MTAQQLHVEHPAIRTDYHLHLIPPELRRNNWLARKSLWKQSGYRGKDTSLDSPLPSRVARMKWNVAQR
jgi:hypothetical protein